MHTPWAAAVAVIAVSLVLAHNRQATRSKYSGFSDIGDLIPYDEVRRGA